MIFKRKIYDKMLRWKTESSGSTALLIKGARRIGKSTIVEEFARKEYESHIAIDFSAPPEGITELFDHMADLDFFFLRLQSLTGVTLHKRRSVVVFDEVQLCPKARQAIKHLVSDGRYDFIETGSLLSIKKNVRDIVIPSEETRVSMYPMDFEEFMWAIGNAPAIDLIRYSYTNLKPLGESVNRKLLRDFRLYMLVGGMPQSVKAYIEHNDFAKVDSVKRNIIDLYIDDFRKIDPTGKASAMFSSIPAQLAKNSLRYRVGSVIENARPSRLEEMFADMADSMTVNFAYHADDPSVGFALHADFNYFKMFMSDTGLFVTLAFMDRDYTDNDIYRRLLSDKLSADLGYVYENIVSQMLCSSGHGLFYYTFREKSPENVSIKSYEIDFLLSKGSKIYPIEVKSSGYKAHKSLDEFQAKYSSRIGGAYLLYTKDLRRDGGVICMPVYMAFLL